MNFRRFSFLRNKIWKSREQGLVGSQDTFVRSEYHSPENNGNHKIIKNRHGLHPDFITIVIIYAIELFTPECFRSL